MPAFLALAVSVGLLAALKAWLFIGPLTIALPSLIWVSFIAWGCHFHSGGGSKGATTAVACMSWGAAVGAAVAILASGPLVGLGGLAMPIAIGLGAAVICLGSVVSLLRPIPASLYGFASIVGAILLLGLPPQQAILPTATSIIIGTVFGYMSETLASALTKKRARSMKPIAGLDGL